MKSLVLLASILFLTVGLAGCSGDPADDGATPDPTGTGTATGTGTGTGTQTGTGTGAPGTGGDENQANTAPVASLVASAVNGTAPLNVTFTLDGSDADGDNLTWTFSVNGTEIETGDVLPADVSYVFGEGNHTVTLTVNDGVAGNETLHTIVAADAVTPPPTGPIVDFTGTWTSNGPVECVYGFLADLEGVTFAQTSLPAEASGMPFTADFEGAVPGAYYGISWFSSAGWMSDSEADPVLGTSISGAIPGGATTAYFWNCAGGVNHGVHFVVDRA